MNANAIEAGRVTTVDLDGGQHEYERALVIRFETDDAIRAALMAGERTFSVFGRNMTKPDPLGEALNSGDGTYRP